MGLFDHLFKPKPETAGEEIVEAEEIAPESRAAIESSSQNAGPSRPDPTTFLHPKNFIPRAGSPILPAPKSSMAAAARFGERKLGPSVVPAASDEIVLTLGDILSRIPPHYLKSGTHDPKRELRFKVNDLSSDIARGRAAVPLSSVARLLPDIFVKEIEPDEDSEVRLPLQKLVEQIGMLRSRPAVPALDQSQRPVLQPPAVRVSPELETPAMMEAIVPPVLEPPRSAPARETLRDLRPDAEKAEELRRLGESLRESFVAVEKAAESAPAAEPPVVVAVPPVEFHAPPAIPDATKSPEALPVKGTDFFSPAPLEPPPVALKPPSIEVLESSFARALAVESEKKAALPIEEPAEVASAPQPQASPAPESVVGSMVSPVSIEPPAIRPGFDVAQEPEPATQPHAAAESRPGSEGTEERIHLSLAAILRQCPPEIIVGQLPPVDDSVRITLPFAPIDRQLNTGKVEISALRFVAALPPRFQKFFTTPPDLKVPIPLEEVFQNLPAPGSEIAPPPEPLPSLILAPVPENAAPASMPPPFPEVVAEPLPAMVQEAPPEPPEPTPAVATAAPEVELSGSVEQPVVESLSRPPDSTPSAGESAPETSSPVSEFGSMPAPADGEKPGLHLPAFHVFAPPPPVVSFLKSEQTGGEPTTLAERLDAGVSEASAVAPLPPEATESERHGAGTLAPVEGIATEATPVVSEPEKAIAIHDAPASGERPSDEPLPPASEALAPEPTREPQRDDAAPQAVSSPSEPTDTATAANPLQAPAPKWEATTQPDASGLFAAATKTILPPLLIRPLIVAPPPLAGFTPAPETPTVETPNVDVDNGALASDFKLVWYDDTGKTKVIPDELLGSSTPPSPPDPAQPELFNPPQPGVEPAIGLALAPDTAAPMAFGEASAAVSLEFAPPMPTGEHEVTPPAMPAESPTSSSPDETAPGTRASKNVAAEWIAPDTASGSTAPAAEADRRSADIVPPGRPAVPEVAATAFAETEIAPPTAPPPPAGTAPEAVAESKIETPARLVADVIPLLAKDSIPEQAEPLESETKAPEPEAEAAKPVSVEAVPDAADGQALPEVPIHPPPPLPLLPLPRLEPSFGMSDVIPPPALQLRRIDQDALQAIFMTEETLDLPKISRLAASLPGVYACVIATRDQAVTGGALPEGFDLAALLGLAPRIREAASRMPIGALKHFTIYGESYSISFFERRGLSLCAIHRARSFVPGVREKLVAIADELSQM